LTGNKNVQEHKLSHCTAITVIDPVRNEANPDLAATTTAKLFLFKNYFYLKYHAQLIIRIRNLILYDARCFLIHVVLYDLGSVVQTDMLSPELN